MRFTAAVFFITSAAFAADPDVALFDALTSDKATQKGEYPFVRAAVATHFEKKYAADIKAAFGDDHKAITDWLAENPDLRETLYTVIDPEADDVRAALGVVRGLYKLGPDKLKAHPQLAIALAVVWDDPRTAYHHRPHQVRTHSIMPDAVRKVGWAETYESLTADEKAPAGAVRQLPWEFLVHVVNHHTPTDERAWAVKKYGKRRAGIGSIYQDVKYDVEMLKTQSRVCQLDGKPYTLPNILEHGGVCAMQADFAARVAKSLAVPAEFVGGEANSGGLHAWVMWAEVKAAKDGRVDFTMLTEGQYQEDKYYVGFLIDPKTGKLTTDRDVTRRLSTVAASPQAARQADLLMRAYPALKARRGWRIDGQRAYLDKVLDLFPHAERAWLELAAMCKDGQIKSAEVARPLAVQAFDTFAKHPDFSWRLLPDLIVPITDPVQRTKLYERAVTAYESLGRPDLACAARLTLAKLLTGEKEYRRAADGLAQTIRRFPDEGRYVPAMLKELADLCGRFDGGTDLLAKFYLDLLPKVPKTRVDEPSEYCIRLHEQAVAFLAANKKPREAEQVRKQLDGVRRGK